MTEGEYIQPKTKGKSYFWKVVSIAVILGIFLLIIWTYFFQKNSPQDNSSLQANSLEATAEKSQGVSDAQADPDKDGLTNQQEERYSTNPNQADTDQDGFSDGEEVKNGYNPNGPGRLAVNIDNSSKKKNSGERTDLTQAEFNGVGLDEVFSNNGKSYFCSITGGTSELNTVSLSVKGKKVRQETPLNGSTLIMIIDNNTFYMSGFEGGKYLKLSYDRAAGIAAGEGAQVKNGIFTSKEFIMATPLKKVNCQEKAIPDSQFEVSGDLLVNTP